jgi:ATP-dependent RNA helicase DeaD
LPGLTFEQLEVPAPVLRAITARGYETPTPVQEAVLAKELLGRDLLVSSRTGSGKTLAFGLVMAPVLLNGAERMPAAPSPLALIVAPTRELANQISEELGWLLAQAGARIATCVGGVEMGKELRALRDGPHIIVGTPGRLVDHLERKSLKPSALKVLVLDEADEMLDMGFREELERILRDTPAERQTLLFSATIDKPIEALARSYQRDAARVSANAPNQAHQDIEVRAHLIASREREHAVVNTLRAADAQTAIVFCGTRDHVNHLHASLVERGFSAVALSGELTQPERFRALKALRDGRARVLVATDVAARGLDLPDVGIVVQADLPQNAEVWQHRSGRTGRAGRKGVSVLLVPGGSQRTAEMMLRKAGAKATWSPPPGPEQIRERDHARLVSDLQELAKAPAEEDIAVAQELLKSQSAENLAAALVAIRRAGLPAPEELPLSAQMQAGRTAGRSGHVATHPTARAREPELAPAWTSPKSGESTRPSYASKTPAPRAHAAETAPAKPAYSKAAHAAAPAASSERKSEKAPSAYAKAAASSAKPAPAHEPRGKPAASPSAPSVAKSPWARKGRDHEDEDETPGKVKRSHAEFGDAVWFSVNVGRARNADPRWLLPLLCRRGGVVKDQIGKIQILPEETRFQIVAEAAGTFEKSAKKPDTKDPGVHVKRVR